MIIVKGEVNCPNFIHTKKDYYVFTISPVSESKICELNIDEIISVNHSEVELSLLSLLLASRKIDLTRFELTKKYHFYNLLEPDYEFFNVLNNRFGALLVAFKNESYVIPLWVEHQYRVFGKRMPPVIDKYTIHIDSRRLMFLSSSKSALNYFNSRFGEAKYSFSDKIIGIGKQSWVSRVNNVVTYNYFNPDSKYLLQVSFVGKVEPKSFPGWNSISYDDVAIISLKPLLLSGVNNGVYKIDYFDFLDLIGLKKSFKTQLFNRGCSRDYRFIKFLNKGVIFQAFNPEHGFMIMKV